MTLAENRKYHAEWMRAKRKDAEYREAEREQQRLYKKMKFPVRFPRRDGDNYRYIGRIAGRGTLLTLLRWLP